jgi:uncharacterized protein (TIGR04168 family)
MAASPLAPRRIVVVGDLHGHWTDADDDFLEAGRQDLVLFVGDLGDEDVAIVRRIADLRVPKAVILGNHDAWQSFSKKAPTDNLRHSLGLLGEQHLAYARLELPRFGMTLVGARPFSWGGQDIRSPEIYRELFGVRNMRESAERIVDLVRDAEHDDIAILAHNGPLGLSSEPDDIYGKDFGRRPGGDWGDQDLAWALERIPATGRRVSAVIAGHMHDRLTCRRGERRRFVRMGGIPFLNPAVVPRIRKLRDGTELRHFLITDWSDGRLLASEEIWIDADGETRFAQQPEFDELPLRPI